MSSVGTIRTRIIALAALVVALPSLASYAGELAMQSNLVRDDFASGTNWLTPKAWNAIPKFETEAPGDATSEGYDWFYTQVAHTKDWFFVRYHQTSGFAGDLQYTLFDTDSNDETGWLGPSNTLAIGADRVLSGASLKDAAWNHLEWTPWNNVTDVNGAVDIMAAIPRSQMNGATAFNFVNYIRGASGSDWYPNAANNFPGDYFRYETGVFDTTTALGRTWSIIEPTHRENRNVQAQIIGTPTTMTFNGVYQTSADFAAVTALTPVVGTKVSYDLALTHEERDNDGDGDGGTWTAEALGAFTSSVNDPSDSFLVSTRVGARPFDGPATRIIHERPGDADESEQTSSSLANNPLTGGVQIEWYFTSETTIEISVFSKDGTTLLGPKYTDTISSINDIHGFRLNLFDSEQTMTISDFHVAVVAPTLDGDFNGDGYVDAKDLNDPTLGWKARFGVDLNGNDFLTWQRNFGAGTPPAVAAVAAVPEPSTALLALMGIVGAVRISRQRRLPLGDLA
ncbi:PEP-CTERM sorting domain-containing protein [Lacipirellula sp.]|uniref:PEP-CTERM sorting domain-containing protein n=1 Tax=Lacipirellula sp. TaxID=2691419 RepID=UPI003D12CD10